MPYAINIGDMTREAFMCGLLIAPIVQSRTIIKAEKGRMDGDAILLECDDVQANAIVQIIRKKQPKHLLRCYKSKTGKGGWKRI